MIKIIIHNDHISLTFTSNYQPSQFIYKMTEQKFHYVPSILAYFLFIELSYIGGGNVQILLKISSKNTHFLKM